MFHEVNFTFLVSPCSDCPPAFHSYSVAIVMRLLLVDVRLCHAFRFAMQIFSKWSFAGTWDFSGFLAWAYEMCIWCNLILAGRTQAISWASIRGSGMTHFDKSFHVVWIEIPRLSIQFIYHVDLCPARFLDDLFPVTYRAWHWAACMRGIGAVTSSCSTLKVLDVTF